MWDILFLHICHRDRALKQIAMISDRRLQRIDYVPETLQGYAGACERGVEATGVLRQIHKLATTDYAQEGPAPQVAEQV
jgi:hypothetical protein